MVDELVLDAPNRTGKQQHSLDQEDENRQVKALFRCWRLYAETHSGVALL